MAGGIVVTGPKSPRSARNSATVRKPTKAAIAQAAQREARSVLNASPPSWLVCGHHCCPWPAGCTVHRVIEVDIPGRPFTTNEWDAAHQARRNELKAYWRDLAQQVATVERKGPRVTGMQVEVQPYYPTAARVDPGNLSRWTKAVLDGLVHAGLLYDDGPNWVTAVLERSRLVAPGPPHVVVRLARP